MNKCLHKTWAWYTSLAMLLASCLASAAIAEPDTIRDPQEKVASTIEQLIDRLQENADAIKTDKSIAYDISDELITPNIDFDRVTRLVIGKYWRGASTEQKKQLVTEVRSLMVRSYATAMSTYTADIVSKKNRISYMPSRYKAGDKKASVRSIIELDGGQTSDVQYKLLYTGGDWKIYDIRIEGISLAITYRTTFGAEIKRDGLDALIAKLAERNRKGDVELPDSLVD